jgi:hypothetical protein
MFAHTTTLRTPSMMPAFTRTVGSCAASPVRTLAAICSKYPRSSPAAKRVSSLTTEAACRRRAAVAGISIRAARFSPYWTKPRDGCFIADLAARPVATLQVGSHSIRADGIVGNRRCAILNAGGQPCPPILLATFQAIVPSPMVLNIIRAKLEASAETVVIEFNPWRFNEESAMLAEFFRQVSTAGHQSGSPRPVPRSDTATA